MNWKKHGLVWVSAGAIITGVIWHERSDKKTIYAEDYAEVLSGVLERSKIAYLTADQEPDLDSLKIPYYMTTAQLKSEIMDAARSTATNSPTTLPAIYWLPETAKHGDVLTSYDYHWRTNSIQTQSYGGQLSGQQHTVYDIILSTPETHTDHTLTTASRSPAQGVSYHQGVSPTNAPLGKLFWGTAGACKNNATWWRDINNGDTAYKYTQETDTGKLLPYYTVTNLAETANVITNLNTSIYICGINKLNFETAVTKTWGSGKGVSYGTNSTALITAQLWGQSQSELQIYQETTNIVFNPIIAYCNRIATHQVKFWDEKPAINANYTFGATLRKSMYKGCELPYPSMYAITNNYVDKISVYIIVKNSVSIQSASGAGQNYSDPYLLAMEISGSYAAINQMLLETLQAADPPVADYKPLPFYAASTTRSLRASTINQPPPIIRLAKVAEKSTPTERFKFGFGNLDDIMPDYYVSYSRNYRIDFDFDIQTTTESSRYFNSEVNILAFAVVVDWKWKHPYNTD